MKTTPKATKAKSAILLIKKATILKSLSDAAGIAVNSQAYREF
jgi:hypothetical protein